MADFDKAAAVSIASAGEIHDAPAALIAVNVTDEDGDPVGVFEKWSSEAWMYADVGALREL